MSVFLLFFMQLQVRRPGAAHHIAADEILKSGRDGISSSSDWSRRGKERWTSVWRAEMEKEREMIPEKTSDEKLWVEEMMRRLLSQGGSERQPLAETDSHLVFKDVCISCEEIHLNNLKLYSIIFIFQYQTKLKLFGFLYGVVGVSAFTWGYLTLTNESFFFFCSLHIFSLFFLDKEKFCSL